ncbi:MAG: SAM-dependent methyltransferase, partial [Planctomycetota bacterium]
MTKRSEDSVTVAHQEWEALAQYDAMWAVLSDPHKHGDRWDPEEFFETGKREIALTKAWVEENGLTFGGARAL